MRATIALIPFASGRKMPLFASSTRSSNWPSPTRCTTWLMRPICTDTRSARTEAITPASIKPPTAVASDQISRSRRCCARASSDISTTAYPSKRLSVARMRDATSGTGAYTSSCNTDVAA